MAPPAFETERLRVGPLAPEHAPDIVALHGDPRVRALLLDDVPDTPAIAALFIAWANSHYPHGYGTFGAWRRTTGAFVGLFSLTPFAGSNVLELGGKLARAGWGAGLAAEAGAALVSHAFDALGREELVSATHVENRPARAVLAQLGFGPAGETTVQGKPAVLLRLYAADWTGARAAHVRRGRIPG